MITAPSTISPKSSAPRLIRLALILPCSMPVAVISMVTGMTNAVISAARKFPSSRNSTSNDQGAPSARFVATVLIVASTSRVRFRPSGRGAGGSDRDLLDFGVRRCATVRLLPPISIRRCREPPPVRSRLRCRFAARARCDFGNVFDAHRHPSTRGNDVSSISARVSTRPLARTT